MKNLFAFIFIILCWGCRPADVVERAVLPEGCTLAGEVIRAELPQSTRGYPYEYRLYLPPCFSWEASSRYPVVYLVPGRSSSPDAWFAAGLEDLLNELILNQ